MEVALDVQSQVSQNTTDIASLTTLVKGVAEEQHGIITKLEQITTWMMQGGKLNMPLAVSMISEVRAWFASGGKFFWAILILGNVLVLVPLWLANLRHEEQFRELLGRAEANRLDITRLLTVQTEVCKQFQEVKHDRNMTVAWLEERDDNTRMLTSAITKCDIPINPHRIPAIPMGEFKINETMPK